MKWNCRMFANPTECAKRCSYGIARFTRTSTNAKNKLYHRDKIVIRPIWAPFKTQVDSIDLHNILLLKAAPHTMENKRLSIRFMDVKNNEVSIYDVYLSPVFDFRLHNSPLKIYCQNQITYYTSINLMMNYFPTKTFHWRI